MLSQLSPPTTTDLEHFLLPAAALLWLVGQWKKVFPKKDDTFATKKELASLSDKIDARFLALSEKLDSLNTQLSTLNSSMARLDERTKA